MNDSNSETHFQWLQIKCLLKSQTSETWESGLSQRLSTRESRWYSELLFCSLALSFHVSATLQSTTAHPTLEPYFTLIFLSVSVPAQEALGELGASVYTVSITIRWAIIWPVRTVLSKSYQTPDGWADRQVQNNSWKSNEARSDCSPLTHHLFVNVTELWLFITSTFRACNHVPLCTETGHTSSICLCNCSLRWRLCSDELVWFNSLSVFFHFAVHPAVPLVRDEQDYNVSLVKAEQGAVVASSVGEDGTHAWPLHYIVQACGYRHRPGKIVVLTVSVVWEEEEEEERSDSQQKRTSASL